MRWGRARKEEKNKTILSRTKTLIAVFHTRPPKINMKGETVSGLVVSRSELRYESPLFRDYSCFYQSYLWLSSDFFAVIYRKYSG